MVGWVKYGPDCWMMEGDGKCRAEADARGLPANRDTVGIRAAAASRGQTREGERKDTKPNTFLQTGTRCSRRLGGKNPDKVVIPC